ncbi:hypothetical protein GH714_036340 [Hevea brasiliensis]|uniref:Cysteine proteinase n=1 Tax=Hevea brasiliensis TaxID=3981 RepID=A0A6A6KND1_HEVBR|nr:hypothetical protein GH714_036340 [Hevea brasiliensis]
MALSLQPKVCIAVLMILGIWASQTMSRLFIDENAITQKHEPWMAQHRRNYQDNAEKKRRFQIFMTNWEYIKNFNTNATNKTYQLSLNKFADLADEEFFATYTGYRVPSLPNANKTTPFRYAEQADDVPESIDWRKIKGAVTSVKDQKQCGCCWAFSAVGAVEGKICNGVSLSAQELVDSVSDNDGCDGGICQSGTLNNSAAQISGYEDVPSNDEEALKMAVANQPVSVAIDAHETSFKLYNSGVFNGDCGTQLTHAVTLVGYGTSTEDGSMYWLIKNSWGDNWGENGYMRLQRDVYAKEGLCGIARRASDPTVD